jgi:hypothetical protein
MSRKQDVRRTYVMTPWLWVLRGYVKGLGIALLIGLLIGIVWVIAGILHFHPLW